MPDKHPYGRRRGLVVVMLVAPPALMLTSAAVQRLTRATFPPSWGTIVAVLAGLEYMFGALAAFLFAHPRPHGTHGEGHLLLRIPPRRRAALATLLPVPAVMVSWEHIVRGAISPGAVVGLAVAVVAALVVTGQRVAVSATAVECIAGLGAHHRIAWSEIRGLEIWPAGIRVWGENRKSIHIPGLLMDGYPEFVGILLERAPAELLGSLPGEVLERLMIIADLGDPTGATRRRGKFVARSAR